MAEDKTPVDNSSQQPDNQNMTTEGRVDKQAVDENGPEDLASGKTPDTGDESSEGSATGNPGTVTGAE